MQSLKLKLLVMLSVLTFFVSVPTVAFAQSPESFGLPVQKTLPGEPSYAFKRLKEKVTEFFKFSSKSKFSYRQTLLEKRVSEYVSLVENKNQLQIANASQRLAYQAGILAESSYSGSRGDKDLLINLFEKYKPILEKMRDNFPANSPFWLLSQQDIDTLSILSSKLK